MQIRLNKQNRDKLVNRLSYKPRQTCNGTVISLLNPGNWKWNPSATMLAGPMNRSDADGICRL